MKIKGENSDGLVNEGMNEVWIFLRNKYYLNKEKEVPIHNNGNLTMLNYNICGSLL